jgi:hypothetical protein
VKPEQTQIHELMGAPLEKPTCAVVVQHAAIVVAPKNPKNELSFITRPGASSNRPNPAPHLWRNLRVRIGLMTDHGKK